MTATYIAPPLDVSPDDLYNQFVAYMQANIPGWTPAQGNLDDWVGLAVSYIAAQLTEVSADVATSIFRYFGAYIVGIPPIASAPAGGTVTITAANTNGPYVVPANTQLLFTDAFGNTQGFYTVNAATIPNGSTTVAGVSVTADTPGSAANNITGNAQLISPLSFVTQVTLTAATSQGTDAETDDVYLARLVGLFQALTPKAISANDFSTLALQQSGVGRAVTLSGYDPATWTFVGTTTATLANIPGLSSSVTAKIPVGASITGPNIQAGTFVTQVTSNTVYLSLAPTGSGSGTFTITGSLGNGGEVAVFVTDSNGVPLSGAAMTTVQNVLQSSTVSNVVVNVLAPTVTPVAVIATVNAYPGQSTSAVQASIVAALQQYLSSATWGLPPQGQAATWINDRLIRGANVDHVMLGVPGAHFITPPTVMSGGGANGGDNGSGDLQLPGVVALPSPGTITVTVNTG